MQTSNTTTGRIGWTVALMLTLIFIGCGGSEMSDEGWDLEDECTGDAPTCTDSCGEEVAQCVDGAWKCPNYDDVGSCEVVDPPDEECSAAAPQCAAICGDAWAECVGGNWQCMYSNEGCTDPDEEEDDEDVPPGETCRTTSESNLPGVSIELSDEGCYWSIQEILDADDFSIPYVITVEEAITIAPTPQTSCAQPGESGLMPFELISGNDQRYCLCNQGLCPQFTGTIDLQPGTYAGEIAWSGHNWSGPSDTGTPKGEPFPEGWYEASVTAVGETADGEAYEVTGTLEFHISE